MKRELVFDLIRLSVGDNSNANFGSLTNLDEESWTWVYNMLAMHGVAAIVCSGIERNTYGIKPPADVLVNFVAADMKSKRSYARLQNLTNKLENLMKANNVKCLLLKGFSLAEYYPKPELRNFADIDIYAPNAEKKVDDIFMSKGVDVHTHFYRHSHVTLGGVKVENHHYLLDVRGRKTLAVLDADLKSVATEHLSSFENAGLYYPDARFSLIFNLHHAMSHFIYEGISFKFLVDWIYFLRKEKTLLETDDIAKTLNQHRLLKFAAVMSYVSVKHLGLDIEYVPEYLRREMNALKPSVKERFIDDLFRPLEVVHKKNIVAERLNSVRRIIRASWKPKEFLGQSAVGFVWNKFLPILMGKTFEAD